MQSKAQGGRVTSGSSVMSLINLKKMHQSQHMTRTWHCTVKKQNHNQHTRTCNR